MGLSEIVGTINSGLKNDDDKPADGRDCSQNFLTQNRCVHITQPQMENIIHITYIYICIYIYIYTCEGIFQFNILLGWLRTPAPAMVFTGHHQLVQEVAAIHDVDPPQRRPEVAACPPGSWRRGATSWPAVVSPLSSW